MEEIQPSVMISSRGRKICFVYHGYTDIEVPYIPLSMCTSPFLVLKAKVTSVLYPESLCMLIDCRGEKNSQISNYSVLSLL